MGREQDMGINDEREIKLTTDRLILREFNENDFAAVHAYASDIENIKYMIWGCLLYTSKLNVTSSWWNNNSRLFLYKEKKI